MKLHKNCRASGMFVHSGIPAFDELRRKHITNLIPITFSPIQILLLYGISELKLMYLMYLHYILNYMKLLTLVQIKRLGTLGC